MHVVLLVTFDLKWFPWTYSMMNLLHSDLKLFQYTYRRIEILHVLGTTTKAMFYWIQLEQKNYIDSSIIDIKFGSKKEDYIQLPKFYVCQPVVSGWHSDRRCSLEVILNDSHFPYYICRCMLVQSSATSRSCCKVQREINKNSVQAWLQIIWQERSVQATYQVRHPYAPSN